MAKRTKYDPAEVKKALASLRGCLKRQPGEKPFAEWMADMNREEKELAEAKFQRLMAMGGKTRS